MTDSRCDYCGGWFDTGYESHDFGHTEDRQIDALEKIAASMDRLIALIETKDFAAPSSEKEAAA